MPQDPDPGRSAEAPAPPGARLVRFLFRFPFPAHGDAADAAKGADGKRRGFPVAAAALVALFVLGYVLVNGFGVGTPAAGSGKPLLAAAAPPYPLSLRAAIEARIGMRTASGHVRVRGVSLSSRDPAWPLISLVSEDPLAPTLLLAREAVRAAFEDARPGTVTVDVARPTPTVFGFPRLKRVLLLSVTRGTFGKADWTALRPEEVLAAADYVDKTPDLQ